MAMAEAAQQRAHQIIAGPHLLHQGRFRLGGVDTGTIDGNGAVHQVADLGTSALQNGTQNTDIRDVRNIFNLARAVYQECSRQNCHGGVLRAADGDAAMQARAALNFVSGQGIASSGTIIQMLSHHVL